MKDRIIELARQSLDFQVDVPYSPLYLLRYFEWMEPYYSFLYLVSREFKPNIVVEIGMSWGIGAVHLALGNPNSIVFTIDLNPEFEKIYKGFNFGIKNVYPIIEDSVVEVYKFGNSTIDLLFIDGDHRYEYAKGDYELYFSKVKDGGIILIDDIEMDDNMRRFWGEIKEPKFDVNFIRPFDEMMAGRRGVGFGVVLKNGNKI